MVKHLRVGSTEMLTVALKRNIMARRRHLCFAQKLIKQIAQHSVRPSPETRDHTQENQESLRKYLFSKSFLS